MSPPLTRRVSKYHYPLIVGALVSAAVLLLVFLPGCHIPALQLADPGPALPTTFNGSTSQENSAQVNIDEFFNDPKLSGLITEALANNQELKMLAQEIEIANNEILARRGAYLPFVFLGTSASMDRPSQFTRDGAVDDQIDIIPGQPTPNPLPDFLVAANISWQVDIWRKLRNARDAAKLRYLATAEGRNYVVTRLVAEIAENYYGLMALDKQLETLDQTISLQEQSLKLAKAKLEAGRGTELAVQRFQAEVRKNQSEKLIVKQEIIERENRINFLAGRYPQPVERASVQIIDLDLHALRVGLPSQLLQNRPDIRQAELELAAAGLDVKVARADFFPAVDITANVGFRAFNPRYLFDPNAFVANAAGNLVAPLINRKAIKAAYLSANAKQLQCLYNYQRIVLNAFTEVINNLSMVENYRTSIELKKQQLVALETSVDVASKLFQAARAEYIEVLFAQRDLMDARIDLIKTKRQQLSAVVNTYQALGGGLPLEFSSLLSHSPSKDSPASILPCLK